MHSMCDGCFCVCVATHQTLSCSNESLFQKKQEQKGLMKPSADKNVVSQFSGAVQPLDKPLEGKLVITSNIALTQD